MRNGGSALLSGGAGGRVSVYPTPKKISPFKSELKVIHVGTPGIFHYPLSGFGQTVCGRDMVDARLTAHPLADCLPCSVCFDGWPGVPSVWERA